MTPTELDDALVKVTLILAIHQRALIRHRITLLITNLALLVHMMKEYVA